MTDLAGKRASQVREKSLDLLKYLLGNCHPRNFAVRLWDGTTWEAERGKPPRFTLVIRSPGALRRMFRHPDELSLGEAYIYDDFDIEGEIQEAFCLADYLFVTRHTLADLIRLQAQFLALPTDERRRHRERQAQLQGAPHSESRDRQAVTYHYNISNDFYRLWLDERMIYSCAYFKGPDDSLDTAQQQKLDYLCRKLRLQEGERLLDIGCGWGGLVLHAVQHYGVTAYGITLSRPQAELAAERIRAAGLEGRCRVALQDYRDLDETETYDKIVSVGMVEHVGKARLADYFDKAWRLLRRGGVFLNHGIAVNAGQPFPRGPSFVDRYVFPDGELLPISATIETAERCGFDLRDLENLREHYARTLDHWVRRLEARHEEARSVASEALYRIWRLYMAGSAYNFRLGRLNLFQTIFVKCDHGRCCLPLTRADWYA